jgi:malyl-CoA/(S)-citramalyl-CoA lyase
MSFTVIDPAKSRLNRSELAVPASQPKLFEKAWQSPADIVFLDLEDSVAPADKDMAREQAIVGLRGFDWRGKTVSVRINGLDTPYMYRDVIDVVEAAGDRLDLIMIPKVGTAADVYAIDMLVTQIEQAKGLPVGKIGFELIIETALGMANINAIAAASKRNESLHFGVADYSASTRARTTNIGGVNPDYSVLTDADAGGHRALHWGDPWHYALSRLVVAARAFGLRPVDGPFGDFGDTDGYLAAGHRAAALGVEGKWAIHPSQIPLANQVFAPSPTEIERATRILQAMEQAARDGRGSVALDGRLIDIASIKQAQTIVDKAQQMAKNKAA